MGDHRKFTDAAIEGALVATDRNNAAAARILGCCAAIEISKTYLVETRERAA